MSPEHDLQAELRQSKWRQGTILPAELIESIQWNAGDGDRQRVVVISHDCDITARPDREAYVEVVGGAIVTRIEGNFAYGKNPRKLCVTACLEAGSDEIVNLDIRSRGLLPRSSLVDVAPLGTIDAQSLRHMGWWLARRYIRAALPDEFNRRIELHERKVRAILQGYENEVRGLYVQLKDPKMEKGPGDAYQVKLYVLLLGEAATNQSRKTEIETTVYEPLVDLFGEIEGVELVQHLLVYENELTLYDRGFLTPLNFDDLSLRQANGEVSGHEA